MNSRGKPLTEFENFKAHFEKTIQWSPRSDEFALKVDTTWSDLLWHLRGDDDLIDDEFLRYLEFITEVCEWRDGRTDGAGQRLGPRTRGVFGDREPAARGAPRVPLRMLSTSGWNARFPRPSRACSPPPREPEADGSKVRLFFRTGRQPARAAEPLRGVLPLLRRDPRPDPRLLPRPDPRALRRPAPPHRGHRPSSLGESGCSATSSRRHPTNCGPIGCRRSSRTSTASSATGTVDAVATLNQAQVEDEKLKAAFLEHHPELQTAMFATRGPRTAPRQPRSLRARRRPTFESRATEFHRLMSATRPVARLSWARSSPSASTNASAPTHGRSCSARTRSATTTHGGSC